MLNASPPRSDSGLPDELKLKQPPRRALTPAVSFLLDLLRFSAAILVVLTHYGLPEFSTGFPDMEILGAIAVPVFFVLSGFVIRYITRAREHTLRVFLIDRASRIYSVVLPALALTLIVGAVATRVAPAYYAKYFGEISRQPFARIVLNLTFLSQSWGHNTIAFCDIPFWSLSYESLYYVAYGLFFFLRGSKRVVALLVWAALAGPQVIFLLPVWWMGCWLYDLFQHLRFSPLAKYLQGLTGLSIVVAFAAYLAGHGAWLLGPVRALTTFSALRNPLSFLHLEPRRATMMALGTGVFAAVAMLGLLLLADLVTISRENVWVRRFRHVADGTFAIYLMHYPLMVLAEGLGIYKPDSSVRDVSVTAGICILLIVLARPLDHLKDRMRAGLRCLLLPGGREPKPTP